jgi:hypothetical protein
MKRKILIISMLLLTIAILNGQFGKNKVKVDKVEWSVIETLHFDIYYPKGADDFGRKVALMSEETYYYLQEAFQAPMYQRVPIIFYESHREFQVTHIIYPLLMEGVGGFTESLRNRVVIPYDGSYKKLEETLIHELVHAYVNAMDSDLHGSRYFNIQRMPFPFWFNEGLPEYLSVGGEDNYNNMFVMDMIFNSYFQPLENVGGFYAYRLGESFLTYIDRVYGRNKVMELFFATKAAGSMDRASERVFGMSFDDIQKRWRNYLLREYTPYLTTHDVPYEVYEQRTDHIEEGSFLNIAPRFAPDGSNYLYFSNRNQRMSIYKGLTVDLFDDQLILKGETRGKFEQFHFLRTNISWFPDSRHFAFVAKTEAGDVLYIMDVHTQNITNSYEMFDFDAIYEIDITRNGDLVVFSGQRAMKNNIYYMSLETREITQITDDAYYDHQPRWSPDGTKILFTSERREKQEAKYDHLFNRLTDQIFYFDLNEDSFYQITDDQFSNNAAIWDSSGTLVVFVSEQDQVANFQAINIETGERAFVTNTLTGVFKGDLSHNDNYLVFSSFYNGGWNIYLHRDPLENLVFNEYHPPIPVTMRDDFDDRFRLYRYSYFGRDDDITADVDDDMVIERRDADLYRVRRSITLHPRPTAINEPNIRPYRVRFFLDRLWGGIAYSSAYGTIGNLQLGLSDIMGDHTIGIQLGIADSFKNSNLLFSYLYLPRRIDYGFGGFYLNDDFLRYYPLTDQFQKVMERDAGIYTLIRYPFNRFWRTDFEHLVYHHQERYEMWDRDQGIWTEDGTERGFIYSPQVRFVHDNILYGPTGPMTGWRGFAGVSHSFAQRYNNYFLAQTDIRKYTLFAKNYSFATRFLLGVTNTDARANMFRLDGIHGVRGFTDFNVRGRYKTAGTLELRFPFIDQLQMQFPLPLLATNIRGSIYTDIGSVWETHRGFQGMRGGALEDIVLGFGMGPRMNLGYFVLKFDVNWVTDLKSTSKPRYFWSINEEF